MQDDERASHDDDTKRYLDLRGFRSVFYWFYFGLDMSKKRGKVNYSISVDGKLKFQLVHNFGDSADIKIIGAINWWENNSYEFTQKMDELKRSGVKVLNVYMNCPGGDVFEANEIYNQLKSFQGQRNLQIGAIAASAATTVMLAFDAKNTKIAANGMLMIHNPKTTLFDAEVKDLEASITLLENIKDNCINQYSKRTGISTTVLFNKMDATWWMTAQEAVDNKFVGSITEEDDSLPEDTQDTFDEMELDNIPDVVNQALSHDDEEEEETSAHSSSNTKIKLNLNKMKNFVTLLLTSIAGMKAFVSNDANEADVIAGIGRFLSEKDSKVAELTNSLKVEQEEVKKLRTQVDNHNTQMITALLDVAEKTEKKITAEQRKIYQEQSATLGYNGLAAILGTITPRTTIKNQINNDPNKGKEEEEPEIEPVTRKDGSVVYTGKEDGQTSMVALALAHINAKKGN